MCMKLEPYFVEKVWGGNRIAKLKNISDTRKLGESWEVSTLTGMSVKLNGEDLSLTEDLPYLVKFIDTTDNLSVQIHPNDEYAQKYENSLGKTECWYILGAEEGAGVYLGLKDGVTKKELEIEVKKGKDVDKLLNFYPAKKGDFFFVPAGTIHAIGAGVFLIEVQQSSGITYRFWDWERVGLDGKKRELHIEKALAVLSENSKYFYQEDFQKITFNGIQVKLLKGQNELKGKGSLTILNGKVCQAEVGDTLFVMSSSNLEFSDDFLGIWVTHEG